MRTFRLIGNLILAAAGLGGSEARYDCWRAGRLSMAFMSMAVDVLFWCGWSGSRDITDSGGSCAGARGWDTLRRTVCCRRLYLTQSIFVTPKGIWLLSDIVNTMSIELNQSILAAALEGFEGQLAKLQGQIAFVKAQISGKGAASAPKSAAPKAAKAAKGKKKGRAVSEEGRQRMAEAQKRRWAKVHAAKGK